MIAKGCKWVAISCFATLLGAGHAYGQADDEATTDNQWWFDVEVIIFDRGQSAAQVAEQFEEHPRLLPATADMDFISSARRPKVADVYLGLPICNAQPALIPVGPQLPLWMLPLALIDYSPVDTQTDNLDPQFISPLTLWLEENSPEFIDPSLSIASQITFPATGCIDADADYDLNAFATETELPVRPFGITGDQSKGPHLLSTEDFGLEDLSLRIRSERGLTRILHMAWRQPVAFGRENAETVRVYGGQNYAQWFDESGNEKLEVDEDSLLANNFIPDFDFDAALNGLDGTQTDSAEGFVARLGQALVDNTELALDSQQDSDEIWQIDGSIKVFLQYVNRVPYLHIDGDIAYRQPIPLNNQTTTQRLASIPYKQLRRVISTQLHYFDHPMFGMLIEIRRYKTP